MKNVFKSMIVIVFSFFILEPVTAQVTSDYDKEVDFTTYKTYSFGGWQDDSGKIINDIDKKRIKESLKAEFTSRGMTYKASDADVVVTLFFVVDNKTSTTAYTNFNGGMGMGYGYGRGYYRPGWGWGMGSATTTYSENDYQVGTFVIDMYDTNSKKLVWQAVSEKTINSNTNKRAKSIPKGVKKLMKKYPISRLK